MENEKTEKTEISENDEKSVNDKNEEKAESKVSKIWFYSKKLIRSVCFFLILGILLSVIGYALMPKNNSQKSGMRNEHSVGFYSESAGSIDVFFLGNSNTYSAFSPIELWREYGIQTYTSGVGYERVVEAYTMVKDLLRFHKPKVIALETDCIFSEKKGSDDIGEAIVVGDASLLPSRIQISEPKLKPRSATVDFWSEWARENLKSNIPYAVEALRRQSKTN